MPIMARKGAPRHAELTLQPCSVGTERRSIFVVRATLQRLEHPATCRVWKIFVHASICAQACSSRVWNGQEREYVREAFLAHPRTNLVGSPDLFCRACPPFSAQMWGTEKCRAVKSSHLTGLDSCMHEECIAFTVVPFTCCVNVNTTDATTGATALLLPDHVVSFSHVACRHTLTPTSPSNSPTAIQGVLPMCR